MAKRQFDNKIIISWLFGIFLAVIMGYGLYTVIINGDHRPLTNADIPKETIDWFNGLWNDTTDIGGILGPDDRDSTDWNQYEDLDSMLCLEDEYFRIYYSSKDSAVEHKKALVSQRYAHEAIPKGELFMKRYPYPNQLNGRKLPIYLAKTVDDFRSICEQLGHGDPGIWAIGLYCFQYSVNGVYTDGIIISPEAWSLSDLSISPNSNDEELKKTLWHEMNHFMYFTYWDYTKISKPCLWFTEGLAEYFSGNYERLVEVDDYNGLSLTEDFRGPGNAEYWAGLSAYLCLEKSYNISTVSEIVFNSYDRSIDEAIKTVIPQYSLQSWDESWHKFMENGEYRNYLK